MRNNRVYLAGPEVFLPSEIHNQIVRSKLAILEERGLEGVDPLDQSISLSDELTPQEKGLRIYDANRALMDECGSIIANLSPFRGVSADPGTVFEVGYMASLKRSVVGFTVSPLDYDERVEQAGAEQSGLEIERFGLSDNLMIEGAIVQSGGAVLRGDNEDPGSGEILRDLYDEQLFEQCVQVLIDQRS